MPGRLRESDSRVWRLVLCCTLIPISLLGPPATESRGEFWDCPSGLHPLFHFLSFGTVAVTYPLSYHCASRVGSAPSMSRPHLNFPRTSNLCVSPRPLRL